MKKNRHRLLTMAMLLCSITASAYDFEVDGIYYDITNSTTHTVGVTFRNRTYNSYSGNVTIPSTVTNDGQTYSVTSIEVYAFYNCSSLTSIIIPESVTSIEIHAFAECSRLTSIAIPKGVISLDRWAFDCSSLTSIVVAEGNTVYDSRDNCNAIIETSTNTLILGCGSTIIPNTISKIGNSAFADCSNLTSMNIPEGVTSIGYNAFDGCSGLTSITIPEGVTSIEDYTFSHCTNLTSMNIPEGVTSIGYNAFYNCSSLTSITIPEGVTNIGDYAFYNCSNLTSIIIPESVTYIGYGLFWNCTSLSSITIPESVTSIKNNTFSNCSNLTSINISKGVTEIDSDVFEGCSSLTSVYISSLEAWCNIDFTRDSDSNPLSYAENLYLNGELVTELIIPNTWTKIKDYVFSGYKGLTSITCEATTPITIGANTFSDKSIPVYVPSASVKAYQEAYYWSEFSNILPFGTCGDDLTWKLTPDRELVIEGSGAMYDYSASTIPWGDYTSSITAVSLPASITSIGDYAFYDCSNLTSITIPESVKSIGTSAFWRCENLTLVNINSIEAWCNIDFSDNPLQPGSGGLYLNDEFVTDLVIPNTVTAIKSNAFYGYDYLTSVIIPESVKSIGECAFMECENLYSVDIANGVTSIGSSAFEDCSNLANVKLPENITRIEASTFENCYNLASICIPKHVESIGTRAFGYSGITSIVIPEDVTSIEAEAFRGCFYLTSITIPKGVTSIGGEAFTECVNLASITCEADIPPTIGYSSPFEGVEKNIPVYVPAASISAYQTAEYWKEFTNIQPLATDYDNTLSINDMEVRSGEQTVLSVNLENVVDITNLQFDLVLPEGITIALDEDGYELIDLSTERTTARKHTIGNEVQADGSMCILCYSTSNAVFSGTEGEVLTITLDIDKSVKEGDYTVRMKNLVLTEYTGGNPIKHTVPSVESTISVYAYTPGDVNDDGAIDVTDISGVVNFILNTASDGLLARAADVNDDGAVDVTDISGVVNLILNTSATAATSSARDMQRSAATAGGSDIRVTVLPFTLEAGEEKEIHVLLDNPGDAFTGIQFDLHLPEGISVPVDGDGYYYVDLGSRTTNRKHALPECSVKEDGSLLVVCYSNSNALFSGEEGDVLVITVTGDEDLPGGVYEMALKNVVLSRPDVTNYKPADYALSILSEDAGEETALTLKGIYTKEVLGQFSAALANNTAITSVDLTASIEVDNTATLTTGNPNTIVYLAEGDALANADNVVIGDECANLMLTDGYAFAAPVAFSASQASYGRELAEGKYGTIVLPYAPDTDDYVFYALTSAGDEVLVFDEVETPVANTPYLYRLRDGKSATQITNSEVTVSSELTLGGTDVWLMVGSYANRTIAAGEDGDRYYYAYTSSDNKIHQVTNTLTVKPYRAYFTTSSTGGTQLAIRTRGGEETTVIDNSQLTIDNAASGVVYDLQGRRVENPAKGIYIVNGKKVVK